MSTEIKRVKADSTTLLRPILSEVRDSNAPIEIEMEGFTYSINPLGIASNRPTAAQIETTESAFGGWKGIVDADELKKQMTEARSSDRSFASL